MSVSTDTPAHDAPADIYLPDVCLIVQACLDVQTFWNKTGRPHLSADVVADILWSSPDVRHNDLIAAIEDGRCATTRALQDTAARTLQRAPYNWSHTAAEYMVTRVIGHNMHTLDMHPISELRAIGLDDIRPRIVDTVPETLAPLDHYNHRADADDARVDLEDLIVLAQVAVLQHNGHTVTFATADKRCAAAASGAAIPDHVVAYLYNPKKGIWQAQDLALGRPDIDHTPRAGVTVKPTRTRAEPQGVNAATVTVGTMRPRQVNSGTATKTKGFDL